MPYDPFAAHNLVRILSLAGLVVMMTDAVPGPSGLAIGLGCLVLAGIAALFPAPRRAVPRKTRAATVSTPAADASRRPPTVWRPPGKFPAKPGIEPHPALFATVAGRTPNRTTASRRRRD
ncbi:hypothetical protein ASG40_14415 [Methylobacterium sp. Leaf399]|uniref:hypothetical protein n=1 Tax=Methylobacterium sp. Leaf399 TaxID=1736364 RepID=UPI0007021BDC|nr:hypothetical protein [Methylobacterium sp. Leaf399]KQT07511.1 hypothetical protein ASG40_14415 [Methylobacterium sp. Leaf399]